MRRRRRLSLEERLAVWVVPLTMALFGLAFLSSLGCAAKVRVPTEHGDVVIDSGLRIVAVCFGEDGKLREVKVYKQSSVFAGQNTVLGLGAGTMIGAAAGAPVPGAAVGGGAGLLTDLVAAVQDLFGTATDPTPSCAPELAPDLLPEEQPKPTAKDGPREPRPGPFPPPPPVPALATRLFGDAARLYCDGIGGLGWCP